MVSYFKYCPVFRHDALCDEYSLINLFSNQVVYSRRNNFNDLFDSKVDFKIPSRERIRRTYHKLTGLSKRKFKQNYMGDAGGDNIYDLIFEVNKILDGYLFYCLTDNPTNNLMWSHYASSHKGFCIEWDATYVKPEKVTYQNELPTLDILELIESTIGLRSKEDFGVKAWNSLKIKLREWKYEQEYRLNLSKNSHHLIKKDYDDFALVNYQSDWVKSIIFGFRMPQKTRDYIRSKLRGDMVYKEAIISPNKNGLIIKPLV